MAADALRSNRLAVRNPLSRLPEVRAAFDALSPEARAALIAMLRAISKDCRASAATALSKHKPPMFSYWKAQAVNARHLALVGVAIAKGMQS